MKTHFVVNVLFSFAFVFVLWGLNQCLSTWTFRPHDNIDFLVSWFSWFFLSAIFLMALWTHPSCLLHAISHFSPLKGPNYLPFNLTPPPCSLLWFASIDLFSSLLLLSVGSNYSSLFWQYQLGIYFSEWWYWVLFSDVNAFFLFDLMLQTFSFRNYRLVSAFSKLDKTDFSSPPFLNLGPPGCVLRLWFGSFQNCAAMWDGIWSVASAVSPAELYPYRRTRPSVLPLITSCPII